jgi:predicted ABC-type ATPase
MIEANEKPAMVVLSGPIGAGKTTFYESHLREMFPAVVPGLFDQQKEMLASGQSFCTEEAVVNLKLLEEGRKAGYSPKVLFVSTEDATLNVGRVLVRMSQGGYPVPFAAAAQSYSAAHENLRKIVPLADDFFLFDNTPNARGHRMVARFAGGDLIKVAQTIPHWLKNAFGKEIEKFYQQRKAPERARSR